jgi:ribosomal protein S18 acetylase RimI-like enzyme
VGPLFACVAVLSDVLRHLHHPMFFREFADTAFVARADGEITGYLLGFVAPTGDGYIHFVAVRDDGRGLGLGRRLYETFTAVALERGATAPKALTSPGNERSIAFHRRMGFTEMMLDEGYAGSSRARVVMRSPLASP